MLGPARRRRPRPAPRVRRPLRHGGPGRGQRPGGPGPRGRGDRRRRQGVVVRPADRSADLPAQRPEGAGRGERPPHRATGGLGGQLRGSDHPRPGRASATAVPGVRARGPRQRVAPRRRRGAPVVTVMTSSSPHAATRRATRAPLVPIDDLPRDPVAATDQDLARGLALCEDQLVHLGRLARTDRIGVHRATAGVLAVRAELLLERRRRRRARVAVLSSSSRPTQVRGLS